MTEATLKRIEKTKTDQLQMRIMIDKKEKLKIYCQKQNITVTDLIMSFIDEIIERDNDKHKQMLIEF